MNCDATVQFLHRTDDDGIDLRVGKIHFKGSGHHSGPADGCESHGHLSADDLDTLFAHTCRYCMNSTTAGVDIEFRGPDDRLLGFFHGEAIAYPCKPQTGAGQWS